MPPGTRPRMRREPFTTTILPLVAILMIGGCGEGSFLRTFPTQPSIADSINVLLIGNSLSGWGDVHTHYLKMIEADERKAIFEYSIIDGTSLLSHLDEYSETKKKIGEGDWDYVILQEAQWALPFPQSEGRARSIEGYAAMREAVHAYNPRTRLVMFLDWMNLDSIEVIEIATGDTITLSRHQFQDMMTEAALDLADSLKFMVAPIGEAWQRVMDERPDINMMHRDEVHPNDVGGYLQACVYYATIFKKSPERVRYYCPGIPEEDSRYLQSIAAETVLTQKKRWRIP